MDSYTVLSAAVYIKWDNIDPQKMMTIKMVTTTTPITTPQHPPNQRPFLGQW